MGNNLAIEKPTAEEMATLHQRIITLESQVAEAAELKSKMSQGRRALDDAVAERNRAFESAIEYEKRAKKAERERDQRQERVGEMLELLVAAAYLAIDNCIIGPSVPKLQARDKRLRNPQPGDWVIELSSAYRSPSFPANIGRLILVREEPHPDWDGEDDDGNGPAPMIRYWYIETFDGSLQKWYDCQFFTLYTIKDLDEDTQRITSRHDPPRLYDPAGTRVKWARDAAYRHKLIVWEPAELKERQR